MLNNKQEVIDAIKRGLFPRWLSNKRRIRKRIRKIRRKKVGKNKRWH